MHRLVDAYPDQLRLARTAAGVREAIADGRIASLIGVEGGAQLASRSPYSGSTPASAPAT